MANPVGDAQYPTPDQILQTILNAIVFAYVQQGLNPPNVLPGSDQYNRAQAYASRVSVAIANNEISAAAFNPLTATGQDLINICALFGITPRPAAPSAGGAFIVVATGSVNIPAGWVCSAPDGQQFQTTQTNNSVTNGADIALIALSPGSSSNEAAGTKLTWTNAAIGNLGPIATVDSNGLVGGVDADNDATLRSRLLQKLSSPPVGGNASSVIEWAEGATASVEAAYVYPTIRGAASYDVAVTSAGGLRILSATTLTIVRNAIAANMPGQNDLNVTSVTPDALDIILTLSLPLPQGAGGSGGGWLDAVPWPAEVTQVTAYSSPTATVNSTGGPTVGNNIAVWDPTYVDPVSGLTVGILRQYVIATVGGSSGAWTFTVTGGFTHTPLNQYVSAGALFIVSYGQSFYQQMATLGPGEKTAFAELLPRASRQPASDISTAPRPNISTRLTSALEAAFPEIINCDIGATYTAGTTNPQTSPTIPTTTADPPGILVINSFAFYKV